MPNSILWIGLVVLWVFVLFPMLANRHPRIRQHTDAALSTRILHRGGAAQRTRKGPATGHDTDPDYVPVRRKLQHPSEDPEDRMTRSDDAAASDEKEVDTEAAPIAEAQTPPAEVPGPEGDSADGAEAAEIAAESESEPAESETLPETATAEGESENDGAVADDADREAERAERQEAPQRARTPALREPDPAPAPEPESEDEDADFVPSRRGRGGFDPEADAAARAARYTFRQRAVLGLVLFTLILAAAGLAVSAVLWWLCALSGTVLVAYLGYLRRQVRIEEDIRRRRAARLAHKRAEDDEEESRRRERPRPDREQTRTQLRRAVLVESDDEDPLFEHLELFDAAAARATRQRAAGARERRAVGE
ncbi:gephyrin-like molybdotransferase receptor GlpR [Nocardia sp. NPDC051981]|uniref:divisome protein SepX/GlpR n=1 Tax=Nocardia sp. NPDC051981 TaxID=3155417 RepID=UPI003427FADE